MILAMIIGIAAPDVEAHPTHGFEHLGVVSRPGRGVATWEEIDIGEIMAVQGARQG